MCYYINHSHHHIICRMNSSEIFELDHIIINWYSIYNVFFIFSFRSLTKIPGYISTKSKISYDDYAKDDPSIEIGGEIFTLKYCSTCCIIRNPRSFHCKICDRYVLRHHRHCDFVSNYFGKNNFLLFFSTIH